MYARKCGISAVIRGEYMSNKSLVVVMLAGIAALAIGCGPRLPSVELSSETQNRIALCTGGYSTSATRAIAAEISRRRGGIITEAETEEKGVGTFAFGEQRGQTAVDMYNGYVACITANGDADSPPRNDVSLPRRKFHELGITPDGEPVVQTPMPGLAVVGKEVQIQIVTEQENSWLSKGTPRWEVRCDFGGPNVVGNSTSYTYRFLPTWTGECIITLYAFAASAVVDGADPDGNISYYWLQRYHVHVVRE